MKFQIPNIHHSKVNRRTHAHTHTDKPKAICPSNFFKVGGIKRGITWSYKNTGQLFYHEECVYEISKP